MLKEPSARPHTEHPFGCGSDDMPTDRDLPPDRRFALRLRLRSVTNYGRDLPPDGHSRQAEEIPALADYRAAPAT